MPSNESSIVHDNAIKKIQSVYMYVLDFEVPPLRLPGWLDKKHNIPRPAGLSDRGYKQQLPEDKVRVIIKTFDLCL
jgi:hypothetical protein